jgi:hypothetical protein
MTQSSFSCPACHQAVLPGDRFCSACGRSLLDETPSVAVLPSVKTSVRKQFRPWLWSCVLLLILGGVCLVFALRQRSQPQPASRPSATPVVGLSAPPTVPATVATAATLPRWQVAEGLVNVRRQPSRQAEVLWRLRAGTLLSGTGQSQQAEGLEWVEVSPAEGQTGWVSRALLRPDNTAVTPTAVPTNAPEQGRMLNHEKLSGWLKGREQDRLLTALAMTRLLFPTESTQTLLPRARLLEACITGSARDTQINSHDVAEIAAICALLLGWQEKSASASP